MIGDTFGKWQHDGAIRKMTFRSLYIRSFLDGYAIYRRVPQPGILAGR
jgi:hypothetical protein